MKKKFQYRFLYNPLFALVIGSFGISCGPARPSLSAYRKESNPPVMRIKQTGKLADLREEIIDFSRSYLGCKYKVAGKDKNGFDCSGFVGFVFHAFDIPTASSAHLQAKQGKITELKDAKAGDLIFFGTEKQITHVGIISANETKNLSIIHSSSSKGVIEENILNSDYWLRRIQKVTSLNSYVKLNEVSFKN